MAAQSSMLHIRPDDDTKAQATETLASMGLSVSDAVRLFLRRVVVEQAFPLELKVPNAETQAAMLSSIAAMRHWAPSGWTMRARANGPITASATSAATSC